ncbi:hypothetical protein D3C76_1648220 [compost metagenome]
MRNIGDQFLAQLFRFPLLLDVQLQLLVRTGQLVQRLIQISRQPRKMTGQLAELVL